jgi:hypothetical protein
MMEFLLAMQEGINAYTETIWTAINANHEKSMARMDAWLTNMSDNRKETRWRHVWKNKSQPQRT